MQVTASAPGKIILFGEHAVVYGKPAIAVAVDRRAYVTVQNREDEQIYVKVPDLEVSGYLNLEENEVKLETGDKTKKGILIYMLKSIEKVHAGSGMNIHVDLNVPIGAGLGSSAAITVATIAAVSKFNGKNLSLEETARKAHEVELEVQGAASPIDTTLSTYGGIIYLSKNADTLVPLEVDMELPLVVGYTSKRGNTGELVESVRKRRENYPDALNHILDSVETLTNNAKEALLQNNEKRFGELMNINHGLLDAMGVNTAELSRMVYAARKAGAKGSKITGAGGGGSIIAYCPGKTEDVMEEINTFEKAFNANISAEGVKIHSGD
jgi:mevalonate kinase